jgi:hypothetical protein
MREARVLVQTDELQEALDLFGRWDGRRHELPAALRDELESLARMPPSELAQVEMAPGSFVCEVVLCTRLLALVGNLRAREPGAAYPTLQL